MNEDTITSLYDRTLRAMGGERTEGTATSSKVAVDRYLDAERFRREQAVARRFPQPVASSSEISSPGSWLARDRFDVPFLLVRQTNGALKAFLNVCRHRGARLVPEGAGENAGAFSCPYHAWTYKADGALVGVPHSFGFPCLDKSASGLRELAVRERAGIVWVIPDPDLAHTDVDAALGPLGMELDALLGTTPAAFSPRSYPVQANWKLIVDGYFEAYHFKISHRETIAKMFADNLQLVDEVGLNRRLYLVKSSFAASSPPPRDGFDPRRYGNLLYYFFPYTTFIVQSDHAQFSTLEPRGPGTTALHEVTLLPRLPDGPKAQRHWDANVDLFRRTLTEDYSIAESIQTGLGSRANRELTFATYELTIPRFHQQLESELATCE